MASFTCAPSQLFCCQTFEKLRTLVENYYLSFTPPPSFPPFLPSLFTSSSSFSPSPLPLHPPVSYEELLASSEGEDDEDPSAGPRNRAAAAVKTASRGKGSLRGSGGRPPHPHPPGRGQLKEEGRGKAWIREGAGDEPVNFMDPVAVKRVLGQPFFFYA